ADTSSVGSISHRDPVGESASWIGRNALGSTSALTAAFTGERSESRCGLKPGPIQSIAMMIWVTRAAGGGGPCGVSVLCGAGGGLTMHPARVTSTTDVRAATTW